MDFALGLGSICYSSYFRHSSSSQVAQQRKLKKPNMVDCCDLFFEYTIDNRSYPYMDTLYAICYYFSGVRPIWQVVGMVRICF